MTAISTLDVLQN